MVFNFSLIRKPVPTWMCLPRNSYLLQRILGSCQVLARPHGLCVNWGLQLDKTGVTCLKDLRLPMPVCQQDIYCIGMLSLCLGEGLWLRGSAHVWRAEGPRFIPDNSSYKFSGGSWCEKPYLMRPWRAAATGLTVLTAVNGLVDHTDHLGFSMRTSSVWFLCV